MAYIAPNSTVQLFKNIPLSDSYSDTLYFSSTQAKDAHFMNLTNDYKVGTYFALSYTRHEEGYVRIEAPMSTVIYANYMRFINQSFEGKWFYAFITDVNYINNQVTEIKFELDYVMTWMGAFTLRECYVERMHATRDIIGANLVNEGFEFDDYVYNNRTRVRPFGGNEDDYAVVIMYSYSGLQETGHGSYHDGVYSGLGMQAFRREDLAGISDFLDQFNATPDSVVAMYMCKQQAISSSDIPLTTGLSVPVSTLGRSASVTLASIDANTTLNGYTPKNKKLLTYPFNFCRIDNAQGNELILKYEFCNNLTPTVKVNYNNVTPVSETLRPTDYKGATTETTMCLTLSGYPICSWTSDAFKAWVAQNAISYGVDTVTSLASAGIGASFGAEPIALAKGALNVVSSAAKGATEAYKATLLPDLVKGNVASGNNLFSSEYFSFFAGRMSIPAQIAQIIDNFFEGYGYAYKTTMSPQMNTRPYWTYLQTKGCIVEGTLPSEHARRIEEVIDNGTRFWKDITQVGRYSLDNSVPS